jgi:pimeloyl-ACP methyl ester carboxylesterase
MAPASIIESSARLDGVNTRTLEVPGDGPSILLLHGFTDSADSWRPLLAQLAAAGRRAVAVDLPNSGLAGPLGPGPVLEALDRFTTAFVRAHANGSPVVIAGNSLGGLLAMRAAQRPDLPLLAVAPISPAGLAHHRRLDLLEHGMRSLSPLVWMLSRLPVPGRLVRLSAEWLYQHRLQRDESDRSLARYYASHFDGMRDVRRNGAVFLALADENRADPFVPEQLVVPVLMIWGRRDPLADVAGAQLVLDAVPASRLVVFEDCGHCAQVQRPADVARLIADLPASAERDAASFTAGVS